MLALDAILCLWLTVLPTAAPHPRPAHNPTTIRATGMGRPPVDLKGARAHLMARRAAEVVAVRNLSVKLQRQGLELRGFRYTGAKRLPGGWVEVSVETKLRRGR